MVLCALILGVGLSAGAATALASDTGFAVANAAQSSNDVLDNYCGPPACTPASFAYFPFGAVLSGIHARYVRLIVPWETAGTARADGACTRPEHYGYVAHNLILSMHELEQAGYRPLLALAPDPYLYDQTSRTWRDAAGANATGVFNYSGQAWDSGLSVWNLPGNPTDAQLVCGAYALAQLLRSNKWGYRVYESGIPVEAYNEPDNLGTSALHNGLCQPACDATDWRYGTCSPLATDPADCAARYFADVLQGFKDAGARLKVIAGAFQSADYRPAAQNGNCSSSTTFAWRYMCYLRYGDALGPIPGGGMSLDGYALAAGSWSFHDYDDVTCSSRGGCRPPQSSHDIPWLRSSPKQACQQGNQHNCSTQETANFWNQVWYWNYPTRDIWVTEAGNPVAYNGHHYQGWQDAAAAWDWQLLRDSPNVSHLFWYELQATPSDGWDSALVDQGVYHASWCALAWGYNRRYDGGCHSG